MGKEDVDEEEEEKEDGAKLTEDSWSKSLGGGKVFAFSLCSFELKTMKVGCDDDWGRSRRRRRKRSRRRKRGRRRRRRGPS